MSVDKKFQLSTLFRREFVDYFVNIMLKIFFEVNTCMRALNALSAEALLLGIQSSLFNSLLLRGKSQGRDFMYDSIETASCILWV